jgi:hypothetical protein
MSTNKITFILAILVFICLKPGFSFATETAQDETNNSKSLEISLHGELVSHYIWRGLPLDLNPQLQGIMSMEYGNFYFGIW